MNPNIEYWQNLCKPYKDIMTQATNLHLQHHLDCVIVFVFYLKIHLQRDTMHTACAGWRCSASLIYCPLVANPFKTTALFPATGSPRIPTKGDVFAKKSITHLNFISKTYNLIFYIYFCALFSMLMTLNHRKSIQPSSRTANSRQKGPKAGIRKWSLYEVWWRHQVLGE